MHGRDVKARRGDGAAWAGVSIGSSVAFIVLLGLLHILRLDLAPSWHFISEYEVGAYGWVMHAVFLSLAISCVCLVVALLPHARGIVGRLGLLLVCLSAAGMTLAGLFAPSTQNTLHETGAMLDQLPLAALLVTWSLWRDQGWRPARRALVVEEGGNRYLGRQFDSPAEGAHEEACVMRCSGSMFVRRATDDPTGDSSIAHDGLGTSAGVQRGMGRRDASAPFL